MIEEILPAGVLSSEEFGDPEPGVMLFPEEERALGQAVLKRRLEFTTVRLCARRAMAGLGLEPMPVVPGPRGEPRWPHGVVGSITHCADYRCAVVAETGSYLALGIDAEPNGPLPPGVLEAVSLREERRLLRTLPAAGRPVHWDRLLFSAKEAVYKTWFPLTRRRLDFTDATITIDPYAGTFSARLLVPAPAVRGVPMHTLAGRWQARGGLLMTAIALPAADRARAARGPLVAVGA
ncbi:4'-phosphopantetheinyl transferase EntD [Streptomyces sp. 3211.6]|uniref:4'-phosphopantetheinyl transferase family protein n=2 Tax=Streptomyces TaxID=1883 RepID=UPI0009A50612|nr:MULTISPECIES: 4'-phosphopantetheinyl transferase superfamily protein [Streptomyces]RKS96930.1 4'-phosphopantetheinyl transferase EntD [Streptomyces sp. 3211.6]RPF25320.1 4'-phosphopantetheinyl transferase EntD [Streptomyces sp. Ag109_G2-6]